MQDTTADLFLSMSITFAIFGICYYYLTTRQNERIAILEKGLPKDYFKDTSNYLPFILLLGIVSIGIALGVIVGAYLEALEIAGYESFLLPCALFFFLGLSLIVSYFVLKAIQKKILPSKDSVIK
ncbi:MAG: DUF6249 domain-containing protein [Chryseolinea sp.]